MLYGDGIHDDTLELQAMLDKCGTVRIEKPGTYLVSKTLKIHSNTRFELCPGAKLLAAPMSRCALIENEHFGREGREENIEIIGGIFDGNCDEMGLDAIYVIKHREDNPYSPDAYSGKLLRFAGIDNFILEKVTVRNPLGYGIQIADAKKFVVRDIFFDYNWHYGCTDGVHVNGPSYDGVIENLRGTTNDDMIGMTTIDEMHAEVTMGEIVNIDIRNIFANNGYSGVRLLSAGNFDMKRIRISGVYGTYRHNAVLVSQHGTRPGTAIWFDDIYIEHIHSSKSPEPLSEDCFTYWDGKDRMGAIRKLPVIWIEKGIKAGNIVIRDVSREEKAETNGALIEIDETAEVERLVMENITQRGTDAPLIVNGGDIKKLIMTNVGE
ncbi:MAG: hypothetical protein IKU61_06865 [Clostridia bacterium]|nr:hypothetical protein [Clostridia bacterium]